MNSLSSVVYIAVQCKNKKYCRVQLEKRSQGNECENVDVSHSCVNGITDVFHSLNSYTYTWIPEANCKYSAEWEELWLGKHQIG